MIPREIGIAAALEDTDRVLDIGSPPLTSIVVSSTWARGAWASSEPTGPALAGMPVLDAQLNGYYDVGGMPYVP